MEKTNKENCSFNGCVNKVLAKTFCSAHYRQFSLGQTLKPLRCIKTYKKDIKKCVFPNCQGKYQGNGYCQGHYSQIRVGKPLTKISHYRLRGSPPRISYVEIACFTIGLNDNCHQWIGKTNQDGYALVGINGKLISIHRYIWQLNHGPIPKKLVIDHICRNRACCNINHLRLVTQSINAIENSISPAAKNKLKTHCLRGHALIPPNLRNANEKHRRCKICDILRRKIHIENKKQLKRKK